MAYCIYPLSGILYHIVNVHGKFGYDSCQCGARCDHTAELTVFFNHCLTCPSCLNLFYQRINAFLPLKIGRNKMNKLSNRDRFYDISVNLCKVMEDLVPCRLFAGHHDHR